MRFRVRGTLGSWKLRIFWTQFPSSPALHPNVLLLRQQDASRHMHVSAPCMPLPSNGTQQSLGSHSLHLPCSIYCLDLLVAFPSPKAKKPEAGECKRWVLILSTAYCQHPEKTPSLASLGLTPTPWSSKMKTDNHGWAAWDDVGHA